MRRLNDTFSFNEREIEVNCYNDMGGSMSFFSVGNFVPTCKVNDDFEIVAQYGNNYNILATDLNSALNDVVAIMIRSKIFVEMKPIWDLEEIDVNGYDCINIEGTPLDIKTVKEYDDVFEDTINRSVKKNKLLVALKEAIDEEDQLRKDYENQHAVYKEKGLISKVVTKIKSLFK